MILGNNADILEDRSQPNDESIKGQNQDYTFKTSRIHILDELCRPIVERVMFHFSSIKSDTVKRPTNHANDNDDKNDRFVENKIVVEHLLDYIKNIIEVPLKMILKAIRPFMTYAVAQLQNHKVQTHEDHETNYNDSTPNVTHVPKLVYYFLNQMVNLAHHILKERDVFRDKKLLGSPPLFTHALEQILSFDQYILNCIYDYEPQGAHSPRLMDLLLLSTPTLLENWLSMEWKGASYLLSSCVVSEKEANVETRKQLNDRFRFNEIPHLVFVSSDAEMFLSLFHSFQRKYGLIANPKARDFIVTKILVPLSMQYLEQLHGSAKKLMKEFEVWGKNGNSAAEKRRSNDDEKIFHLTKDELLRKIIHEWCDILTGANLVIHILMEKQTDHNHINQYHTDGHNIEQNEISSSNFANDLSRVGNSLQRLQEAMIEECVAFLVENMMIEKAKMAMYLMQCPHLLSLSSCNHTGIYESPTISLDIIDAVHILSILTESCNEKLNHVFESCNNHVLDSVINGGSMIDYISFGADTLLSCMAIKISQKFLEIVLDDLQVFEIRLNGASQFLHDIEAVISLFKYAGRSYSNMTIENNGAGMGELFVPNCFRRLYSLIKLMTLDWRQYQSLKNAMLDLCRYKLFGANSFGDSSPTDVDERRTLSLDTLESDTTVMSEARSMLDAKGFASLEISDAVLIMNRRTE